MLNTANNQNPEDLSQREQLLNFCDEFTEFADHSTFFCESISAIFNDRNLADKESRQGLKRYAQFLKDKSRYLQSWLQHIQAMDEQESQGQLTGKNISE